MAGLSFRGGGILGFLTPAWVMLYNASLILWILRNLFGKRNNEHQK